MERQRIMDHSEQEIYAGLSAAPCEGGFTLTLRPDFPMAEARCLAVTAASWVREAAGGEAEIHWPNRVVLRGEALCGITCRAAASGEIIFTFMPTAALNVPGEDFARDVVRAAARDLSDYPENRSALMTDYCAACVTVMKYVEVTYRGLPLYGFAFAVDKHGGLMVMTQSSRTVVTVYGGDARIVPKDEVPVDMPDFPNMSGG